MVKKLFKKHRMGKLEKRDKKLLELQREIMEYEIKVQKLKINEMAIYYKNNGRATLCNITKEEMFEYILTPVGELEKNIPFSYSGIGSEIDYNNVFYENRQKINVIYKEKAEKELTNRNSESSRRWAITAAIAAIISIVIPLIIAIVK